MPAGEFLIFCMKKIYLILSVIAALAVLIFLASRFMPAKYITGLLGKDNAASSLACSYPVKVVGDSMEPYFENGQMAFFNKCFTANDIAVNKTIAFKEGNVVRLGMIDNIEDLPKGLTYKVIQPNRKDRISDVAISQIVAVYKEDFSDQAQKETAGELSKPTEIKMSGYNLSLPAGWQIAQGDDKQTIFINASETPENNFQTYLALSKDKIQSKTIAAYGEYLKDQIRQSVAGVSFSNENIVKINNREAFAMEGYVRQNQTNFKILTAALKGDGDEVWVFNFNTVENKWENNAPVFEQILNSFSLK